MFLRLELHVSSSGGHAQSPSPHAARGSPPAGTGSSRKTVRRGRSSIGRAPALQAEGCEFDSHRLHVMQRYWLRGRAAACRTEGRGFESRMRRQVRRVRKVRACKSIQGVAQKAEPSPRKGEVVGSIPATLTSVAEVAQWAEAAVSETVQCGFESLPRYQYSRRSSVDRDCRAKASAEVRFLPTAPDQSRGSSVGKSSGLVNRRASVRFRPSAPERTRGSSASRALG